MDGIGCNVNPETSKSNSSITTNACKPKPANSFEYISPVQIVDFSYFFGQIYNMSLHIDVYFYPCKTIYTKPQTKHQEATYNLLLLSDCDIQENATHIYNHERMSLYSTYRHHR